MKLLVLVTAIRVKFISEFKGWQEAITILIVAPFWLVIITSSIHVIKQSSWINVDINIYNNINQDKITTSHVAYGHSLRK